MKPIMDIDIAKRIRSLRERLDMSQRAFAEMIGGLPPTTISKYEQGLIKPSAEILSKLGNKGVNINWLLTGEGLMFETQDNTPSSGEPVDDETRMAMDVFLNDAQAQKVALMFSKLDAQERRNILQLAESLQQASNERKRVERLEEEVRELKEKVAG